MENCIIMAGFLTVAGKAPCAGPMLHTARVGNLFGVGSMSLSGQGTTARKIDSAASLAVINHDKFKVTYSISASHGTIIQNFRFI